MKRSIFLFVLMTAASWMLPWAGVSVAQASGNPFLAGKKDSAPPADNPGIAYPAFLHPLMQKIVTAQMQIRQSMVARANDIRQHPFGLSFQIFMLLSFCYGMVHALGPGHGKIYACAYFLNRPGTIKRGLLLGGLTMLFHVLSATILILVGTLILETSGAMTLENTRVILERVSYGLLIAVGAFLAFQTIKKLSANPIVSPNDCRREPTGNKSLFLTALAVGIVPCPGAAMVLLFSLTLGMLPAGLAAMVCIAAGMSITTSLFAVATIILKTHFLTLAETNRRLFSLVYASLTLMGATGITVFGSILLTGSFLT